MLTQERLQYFLHYDPETGEFTWRNPLSPRMGTGDIAGYIHLDGYRCIRIMDKDYKASRLAFLYMEGYFPEHCVDHKDGYRDNNKWENLRHASVVCNLQNRKQSQNNSSGFIGVDQDRSGKWQARANLKGKRIHLGTHPDKISAAIARCYFEYYCPEWKCNNRNHNFQLLRKLGYYNF